MIPNIDPTIAPTVEDGRRAECAWLLDLPTPVGGGLERVSVVVNPEVLGVGGLPVVPGRRRVCVIIIALIEVRVDGEYRSVAIHQ